MYPNLNAPANIGANVMPNIAPNVAPMPTYSAPAYGYDCLTPAYGYGCHGHYNFVLIVVLFILLIIVGASFYGYGAC
ncbi:YjcZ family sporulation protein [Niallia oryzisoli]